ncbi:MAG TPA: hypothetical protein VGZ00_03525 [Candidatus Baltobacteraceae bacterium]|jgi:hypothetical protein|nr:hypothetical protein [Candidatus Baltobacteraceae bacterium]
MRTHRFFRTSRLRVRSLLCSLVSLLCVGTVSAQTATPTATPWAWPSIPSCLSDPGISTPGTPDYTAPVCTLYDDVLQGGGTDVELISARQMNVELAGVLYPAFLPGTEAVRFVVSDKFDLFAHGPQQLVRVSLSRNGARFGSWWTTLDQVSSNGKLLSADKIRSVLALTYTPACIAYADHIQAGVRAYLGVTAPAFDQRGGGAEWWFPPDTVVSTTVRVVPDGPGCP